MITIPICFLEGVSTQIQSHRLHGLCDASQTAQAAVVYLVMEMSAGQFVKFIASKTSRTAPRADHTMTRAGFRVTAGQAGGGNSLKTVFMK